MTAPAGPPVPMPAHGHGHVARAWFRFRRPPGKLLDVGCAAGFFLDRARLAGWEVTGIEVSRDTAEIARERYGLEVQTGRLESAVLEAGSFDCVTMWDVIEHVPDPAGSLARARDLLVAGGLLAIVTPNIEGLYPRASLPLGRRVGWWPHAGLPGHLFQFGEGPLRRMLEAHGFAVSAVRHRRIPLFFDHRGSILRVAFAAAFSPSWVVRPWVRRGDEILVAATRR